MIVAERVGGILLEMCDSTRTAHRVVAVYVACLLTGCGGGSWQAAAFHSLPPAFGPPSPPVACLAPDCVVARNATEAAALAIPHEGVDFGVWMLIRYVVPDPHDRRDPTMGASGRGIGELLDGEHSTSETEEGVDVVVPALPCHPACCSGMLPPGVPRATVIRIRKTSAQIRLRLYSPCNPAAA